MTEHGEVSKIDVYEHGRGPDGSEASVNRRLFVQLQVFTGCTDPDAVARAVESLKFDAAVYLDVNDPRGIGLLTLSENPADFVKVVRPLLSEGALRELTPRPEYAMLGRTYASGYEPNVEDWLLMKPRRTALNPDWPWAIWYPLRRVGSFNALPGSQQSSVLREHGGIGRLYGEQDLAHDIRLACHGIDTHDNDFVIGLIGKELQPLSHLVQTMRKTRQTSEFMQHMGPFFVGHVHWQSPSP